MTCRLAHQAASHLRIQLWLSLFLTSGLDQSFRPARLLGLERGHLNRQFGGHSTSVIMNFHPMS